MPSRLGVCLLVAAVILVAMASHDAVALAKTEGRGDICGGPDQYWACGEILVKPKPGANIQEILARHGGNATDVLRVYEWGDLGTWFLIAVPVGEEDAAVSAFLSDPDIAAAEKNTIVRMWDPPVIGPPQVPPVQPVPPLDLAWAWWIVGLAGAAVAVTALLVGWRADLAPRLSVWIRTVTRRHQRKA